MAFLAAVFWPPEAAMQINETAFNCAAEYWDLMIGDRQPYVNFYCSLLDPEQASFLDLGCGTGTVTLALARALRKIRPNQAIRIAGVDSSRAMLKVAAARDPDIKWVEGDLRCLRITGPFDLAISCYNTLQHVDGNDLTRAFCAVRSVLAKRGRLAFDIYKPNLPYIRIPQKNRLARELTHPDGRRLEIREDTDFDDAIRRLRIAWALVEPDRPASPLALARFQMWQHEPEHVEQALAEAGFAILEKFGGLDQSPYLETSKKQVMVCQAI